MKLSAFASAFALASSLVAGCGGPDDAPPPACDVPGEGCTWLGVPNEVGFTEDGLDRRDTTIYWTMDTLHASDGVVWFIDWNNHIVRKVTPDGKVHTVVGWVDPVFPGDGNIAAPMLERMPGGDVGTDVQLNHPTDLHETPDGKILLMAWHNHKIREIDPATGHVRILTGGGAGYTDGPLASALWRQPSRFAFDEDQNMYVLDQANLRIRKVTAATQMVSTIAGKGTKGFSGDGGAALDAQFAWETGSNPEPSGGLVYKDNALYIADTDNNRIRKLDLATNIVTTIAGTGEAGFGGDGGPATAALLSGPRDVEIGPEGDLYIADTDNGAVRAIELATGTIRTVVGTGTIGYQEGEEVEAASMQLHRTFGIDFDASGNLFVSDSLNSRIVRVNR